MADTIIQQFADFALKTKFEDLPADIVRDTKMILMDALGCALVAKRFGDPPEASVIGSSYKVALSTAALINGELMFIPEYISFYLSRI